MLEQLLSVLSSLLQFVVKLKEIIFDVVPKELGLPPKIQMLFVYLIILGGLYAMFSTAKTIFKIIIVLLSILLIVEVIFWLATGRSP